jgi:DNA-binding NtrC family response regulator
MTTLASSLQLAADVRPFLANPFEHPPDFTGVRGSFSDPPALRETLRILQEGDRTKEALWVLAAAAFFRHAIGQNAVYTSDELPDALVGRLGVTRVAVGSVVRAARRCSDQLEKMVGASAALKRLRAQVWKACFGPSLDAALRLGQLIREQNVLILGETGTGKELVAAALQAGAFSLSHADAPPTQSVNAAAIPEELLESELFGHVKGAFSAAVRSREGKLAIAHGGTFFLDEVADFSPRLQPKLLRVMETNRVTPIGSNEEQPAEVRYLAATSRLIQRMADRGEFRPDLYERLAGLVLEVPPLRDRPEDVPPIAEAILDRLDRARSGRSAQPEPGPNDSWMVRTRHRLAADMVSQLQSYRWPGNVRELENFVRTRLLGFDDAVPRHSSAAPAPAPVAPPATEGQDAVAAAASDAAAAASAPADIPAEVVAYQAPLEAVTAWYIQQVLDRNEGNQLRAARVLGIDRGTLARHLKRRRPDDPEG